MQKSWILSIICISIISIIFGWVRHADAQGEQEALQLLNTVKPYMTSENQIIFKYTGYYSTCSGIDQNLLQVGKKLSQAFGTPQVEVLSESNSHPIYTAKSEVVPGAVVTVAVASPLGQAACYVVLRLDASDEAEQSELVNWQEQASEQLKKLGINGQWNVMVQGYVNEQEQSGQKSSTELVNAIALAFKGKIVESYKDQKTVSASLASKEFHSSVKSGNQTVNLQVAMHQESTTGKLRLTVGTPIITMEY
ncbi:YwmB family TATA-box binding protein [Paenibacillus frigoriresistens]|uniref:YwmB family TATA-box binding protein n=1 Tax=Paenibacillus alginolyticus TaxID=59839 RepID=UPI001564A0E6|nr:YwmB family TATA-box binding protein [Paenibacillus frigoriresistens]NRF95895.1 YwmB family TATA-box binding protein [Paenibacillus frigoriresistens]